MSNPTKPQHIAVVYKVIDLKQAFMEAHDFHVGKAAKHSMGEQGFHETLASQASESLRLIEAEGWQDYDAVMFPDTLADFATATTSSQQGLKTFGEYYQANRLTVIQAKDAIKLLPR